MATDKKIPSVNQQDHPHQEGQQNNTPPVRERDGQQGSDNRNQQMSNMKNDPENQNAADMDREEK